jgi:HAE1 family hydrophobic/amphiphilic exporter-1
MTTKSLRAAARHFASLSLAVCCTLPAALPAFAQDPAPTQQTAQAAQAAQAVQEPTQPATPPAVQQDQQITTVNPVSRPIPARTIGLEPGKVARWTLRDAVLAALENNPDIEIERTNVRQAGFDLLSAQGAYDPISTQGFSYRRTTQPNTRPFSGADSSALSSTGLVFNFGHQGLIYNTGGSYQVNFNNTRSSSNFSLFTAQYDPQLNFSIVQPLFRNYKIDPNRRQIQISRKRLDLSDAVFRQRAIEIISRVQQAYWDLAFSIKDEEIQRDSVKLAETQLSNNKRQVEVGTLAPIDVVSAATQLEARRQQVFAAMNTVAQAENALKNLTLGQANADLWSAQITPVESFDAQPVTLPLADAQKLAVENRPELKQFALTKDINKTDIDFLRNQTKPQIDLVGGYTTFGTGGNPRSAGAVADTFIGGYGTGLKNLFSNDFRSWNVGVNITIPWRNRTAKANLGRAVEEEKKIEWQTRRQLQNIEVEVRNAVQSVETGKMRIDASKASREYAEQQLVGENKRFEAGLSSTFLVLQRQNELAIARGSELRAQADYNKAVAELQRVISTTLSSNSLEIKPTPEASIR